MARASSDDFEELGNKIEDLTAAIEQLGLDLDNLGESGLDGSETQNLLEQINSKLGDGAGRGGSGPSGGLGGIFGGGVQFGAIGQRLGSFARQADASFASGVSRAVSDTPEELAARGAFGLASDVVSGVVEKNLGKTAGALVRQQFNRAQAETFEPIAAAGRSVGDLAGDLAAAGVRISDEDLKLATRTRIEQERARFAAARKAQQMAFSIGLAIDANSITGSGR